jgi:predicted Mrr-cat superfamily restriction endonuclease
METKAWIVRIAGREDRCFANSTVAIGWANAKGLNQPNLTLESLRRIVSSTYTYTSTRSLAQAAGSIWRFTREIRTGHWIIAPTWTGLNIARVTGPIIYDQDQIENDSAWRFPVEWRRRDISRKMASAPLQARSSSRQTCVEATDFISEIERLCREEGKPSLDKAIFQSEAVAAIGKVLDEHLNPA